MPTFFSACRVKEFRECIDDDEAPHRAGLKPYDLPLSLQLPFALRFIGVITMEMFSAVQRFETEKLKSTYAANLAKNNAKSVQPEQTNRTKIRPTMEDRLSNCLLTSDNNSTVWGQTRTKLTRLFTQTDFGGSVRFVISTQNTMQLSL